MNSFLAFGILAFVASTAAHGAISYQNNNLHSAGHGGYGGAYDGGYGGAYDGGYGGAYDGGYGGGHNGGYGHGGYEGHDHYSHPQYKFDYGVKDSHTGDNKDAWEARDGDHVKGGYQLKEADGTTRVVEYVADDHNGFNAVVKRIGHAVHPQNYGHGGHAHGGYGYGGLGGGYGAWDAAGHGGWAGDHGAWGYGGHGHGY